MRAVKSYATVSLVLVAMISCLTQEPALTKEGNLSQYSMSPNLHVPPSPELKRVIAKGYSLAPGSFSRSEFLLKPGNGNLLSVLRIESKERVTLNPVGADYGLLPDLEQMTRTQCEQLWGNSRRTPWVNTRTYSLLLKNKPCSLEVEFVHNRVNKYRLRGDELNTDWLQPEHRSPVL